MNSIIGGLCALMASVSLMTDLMSLRNDAILTISCIIATMLGAAGLVRFRPEPTIQKGIAKTLWSTALGLLLGWNITDGFNVQRMSAKMGLYALAGLASLMVLQSLVIVLSDRIPTTTNSIIGGVLDKLSAFLGGNPEKQITVIETKTTEVKVHPTVDSSEPPPTE